MKKILILLSGLFFLIACREVDKKTESTEVVKEQPSVDSTSFTQIEWLDPLDKQLGKLTPNKEIEITWNFKNSGDKPLVIQNVSASCGCTIPEKPEQPLAPGETGTIKAKFNGSGMGIIVKQVHVLANTTPSQEHTLSFGGEITEKK